MGVHGGKFAIVNGVPGMRNWTITENRPGAKAVNSATQTGTARRKGPGNWSGSFAQHGHTPPVMPGASFSFAGYTSPSNDVSGTGQVYSGTARVSNVVITWDWATAAIIGMVTNFTGHLVLSNTTGSYSDATDPVLPGMCGLAVTYGDANTPVGNLTQAVLTISSALQTYVNSSTACWTGVLGGPIDATLALTQQDDERVAELATGEEEHFKLFVDDTDYWWLGYGHIEGYANMQANRETGAIIQRTINLGWNSNKADDSSLGWITKPGLVDWFGTHP